MRFNTKDNKVIFGIDSVQDFFIQVYDDEEDMIFAMQETFPTSMTPFSFENLIKHVSIEHLQEIMKTECRMAFSWDFRAYFKDRCLVSDELIDHVLMNVHELDATAILTAHQFIAENGNEHQLILKDYRLYEMYQFQCDPEEYDERAGDALFYNTYTHTHEIYTIWLDSFDSDGNVSFYLCLPSDAEDEEESVVVHGDDVNIIYSHERVTEQLLCP
ncbi:MAG: hypothetical protein KBT36_06870 [Kurthia sp.]|nr:hypothetical protein [Candidatus Kurthia equi]